MLSLFVSQIPEDTVKNSRFSYIEQGEPVSLEKLGKSKSSPESDYQTYIESCIAGLLKVNTFLLMYLLRAYGVQFKSHQSIFTFPALYCCACPRLLLIGLFNFIEC